jgi:AcrR family transcriptional regulator
MGERGRAPLSKRRVIDAAVALADEAGVGALTMRKLAERLGVEAMSLYHHVANKDEILGGMIDVVFSEIELPAEESSDWRGGMRQRAKSARDALLRHPWAVGLMDSPREPGPSLQRHHESVLRCLRGAGFSVEMAAHAFAILDSYIFGFVLQELSLPVQTTEEVGEWIGSSEMQTPSDAYPHLIEMAQFALKEKFAFANEFEYGLDFILDGLQAARC